MIAGLVSDPERALTLAYAPAPARAALAALWRLDERLGAVVAATREERLGEIRLAWWREALARLDTHAPPDEPILREVATELVPRGVSGVALGEVADGWAALLTSPLDDAALARHAAERGAVLFGLAGALLGDGDDRVRAAGAGWALVDVAFHLRDVAVAERAVALALARQSLSGVEGWRWPSRLRALGALAVLAGRDAAAGRDIARKPGSPARVGRALLHRVTGL